MIDNTINIALTNINKYITELDSMENKDVANILKVIYNEGMYKGRLVKFNLAYRDEYGNIAKVCNEKYIYEYYNDEKYYYRKRTEIDGDTPFEYPPEVVEENRATIDLQQMEYYRPIYYVK